MAFGKVEIGFCRPGIHFPCEGLRTISKLVRAAYDDLAVPPSLDWWLACMGDCYYYHPDWGIGESVQYDVNDGGCPLAIQVRRLPGREGYTLAMRRVGEDGLDDRLEVEIAQKLERPRAAALSVGFTPELDEEVWTHRIPCRELSRKLNRALGMSWSAEGLGEAFMTSQQIVWNDRTGDCLAQIVPSNQRAPATVRLTLIMQADARYQNGDRILPFWLHGGLLYVRPRWWTVPRLILSWHGNDGSPVLTDRWAIRWAAECARSLLETRWR